MFKQITATIFLTTLTIFVFAQNTVQDYVNRFGNIAIVEMQRTGIPASVILAQGILTSSFGNSQLALQANNHFNLHCDEAWDGELFYKWERGEQKKRPSCFRVYSKPEESFLEFTNVVSNHNQIASLVSYEDNNYKHWVKKLVELGFSKKSEDQMLRVIEQFTLAEFDEVEHSRIVQKNITREVYSINGLKAVVAKNNDTPLNVATELNVPYSKILKYNDLKDGDSFVTNQYIFIEAKRKRSKINEEFHVLRTGETIYDVAQLYGIRLKSICKLNHVRYNDNVASGERIYLVESAPVRPRLQGQKPLTKPRDAILAPGKPNLTISDEVVVKEKEKEETEVNISAPSKPNLTISDEVVVKEKEKEETEVNISAPGKPNLTNINTVVLAEEAEDNIKRFPPSKPVKKKLNKEEVLSYVNTEPEVDTDYVIPSPGHTNVNIETIPSNNNEEAAKPIIQAPPKPVFSKFNPTGEKEKETIVDVLKPKKDKSKELPHSNSFDSDVISAPTKPNFNDLPNSNLLNKEEDELNDGAAGPEFNMNEEEAKPVVKVKRDGYHIVAKGETLYRISVNYGITVGQIRKWNNLRNNTIEIGQELKIKE